MENSSGIRLPEDEKWKIKDATICRYRRDVIFKFF